MPPSAVSRRQITDRLIAELEEPGFPVGDSNAPTDPYGWSGEPNLETSTFTPWMSISALTAQSQRIPGALGDTGTEWNLPYAIFFSGVTRPQCEALADKMRLALTNIERETITTPSGNWRIQKVSCVGIGAMNRVGSSFPDYFTQTDSFEVWISKGR